MRGEISHTSLELQPPCYGICDIHEIDHIQQDKTDHQPASATSNCLSSLIP